MKTIWLLIPIYLAATMAPAFYFGKNGQRRSKRKAVFSGWALIASIAALATAVGVNFSSFAVGFLTAPVLFAISEVALRAKVRPIMPPEKIYRFHPYKVWELIPNKTRACGIRHNNHGFRGPDIEVEKPKGVTRIFLIVGSTTYDYFGPEGNHTGDFLSKELAARHPGKRFEVLNAGVDSYQSMQSLIRIASQVVDFSPDILIVLHATNDVAMRLLDDFSTDYSNPYIPFVFPMPKWWEVSAFLAMLFADKTNFDNRWFPQRLDSLYQLAFKPRVKKILDKNNLEIEETKGNMEKHSAYAYRRNLLSMIGLGRIHNFNLIFCTQPFTGHSGRTRGIEEHNEVIRSVGIEHGITLAELDKSLSQKKELFSDYMHMNVEGQKLKAAKMAETLDALL